MTRMRLEHRNSGTSIGMAGTVEPYRPPSSIPRRLLRFFRLVIFGAILGACVGCLWCYAQPPRYQSTAHVQIVERDGTASGESNLNDRRGAIALNDESYVIRSERLLRQAAEAGRLDQSDVYFNWSPDAIAADLRTNEALVVSPGSSDARTRVIQIQFEAPDPITPQMVVQSILDVYVRETTAQFEQDDDEALQQVIAARDEAAERLRELERQHDEFKQETNLVYVDGEPQSVHRKTADRYLTQREELLVNQAEIQSRLSAAEDSLERGESPATVLVALRGQSETASDVIDQVISNQLQRIREESQDRGSVRLRESQLLPLQLERDEAMREFGAGHPSVRTIDRKIELVEIQIANLEQKEKAHDELIAKAMSLRQSAPAELDPEKEIRHRVEVALNALRQQLDSVQQQLSAIDEAYDQESEEAKLEIAAIRESRRFERDIARQSELYQRIVARVDDVQLANAGQQVQVIPLDDAPIGIPIERPMLRWTATGAVIGLVATFLIALLLPLPPPKNPEPGFQLATQGENIAAAPLPMLSAVDHAQRLSSPGQTAVAPKLLAVHSPDAPAPHGFNAIRTGILFGEAVAGNQLIQITSAAMLAGRSTVSANLAIAAACSGKRVLLLDADLRESNIQSLFGLTDEGGLGWLLESIDETDSRQRVTELVDNAVQSVPVSNLSVITAGQCGQDPSNLLAASRIPMLFDVLRDRFDLVVVETPAMSPLSDASIVAPRADAVLLVMPSSESRDVSAAARAAELLTSLDANVLGVVVHCTDEQGATVYQVYPVEGLQPPISFDS